MQNGTTVNGTRVPDVTLARLELDGHYSIRLRIGVDGGAANPGGMKKLGRGFGNHEQDVVMRLLLNRVGE